MKYSSSIDIFCCCWRCKGKFKLSRRFQSNGSRITELLSMERGRKATRAPLRTIAEPHRAVFRCFSMERLDSNPCAAVFLRCGIYASSCLRFAAWDIRAMIYEIFLWAQKPDFPGCRLSIRVWCLALGKLWFPTLFRAFQRTARTKAPLFASYGRRYHQNCAWR